MGKPVNYIPTNISLSREEHALVTTKAEELKVSKAEVIRQAIHHFIPNDPPPVTTPDALIDLGHYNESDYPSTEAMAHQIQEDAIEKLQETSIYGNPIEPHKELDDTSEVAQKGWSWDSLKKLVPGYKEHP